MKRTKEIAIILAVLFLGTYVIWATVSTQTTKVSFACNGSATTFACTGGNKIPCFAATDIKVYIRTDSTGAQSLLTLTSDYSVTAFNNDFTNGFTVTTIATYASGKTLVVKRAIALTQDVNLIRGRAIPAEPMERTLDRQILALQDLREEVSRSIRARVTDPTVDFVLPSTKDTAGKYLAIASDGLSIVPTDGTTSDIVVSSFMETVVDDATAAAALTTLGLSTYIQTLIDDVTAAAARTTLLLTDYTATLGLADLETKGPWKDVRAYGATGNGTTDDTSALQAAIDDATAYGTVVLPPGTYKFSQLKFYNPIYFTGLGAVAGRWNDIEAAIELLHDESTNPAIIIGGTSDSNVTEGAYYITEGITLANFLLYPTGSTANVGILVDGSTTIYAQRGPSRGIRFDNVVVRDFGSNNIKFLGGAFDIVFKGGGSSAKYATGIYGLNADYFTGGTSTPSQIHFYDFYSTATTGLWNYDGRFVIHGGGIAYGNGFKMRAYSGIYGTHIEGWPADPASIGIQILEQYVNVSTELISGHDTAIKIGDGAAGAARYYSINTTIATCTLGLHITDTGTRNGSGVIRFDTDVTTDIQDDKGDTDGVYNQFRLLNDTRRIETIKTLDNTGTPSVGDSMDSGGIFLTGGTTTITDFDDGYVGQVITIIAEHSLIITDGTNIFLSGSTNWAMTATDTLTLICKADNKWYEISRSDSGA